MIEDLEFDILHEVRKLNKNVEKLIKELPGNELHKVNNGNFVLWSENHMVWWTKVENAARYCLKLIVGSEEDRTEISTIELDRQTRYFYFDNLPKDIYFYAKVEAEDREGKILISESIEL